MKAIERAKVKYKYVGKLSEGRIAIGKPVNKKSKELKFGFINANGKEIIPPVYDTVWDFCCGFARVNKLKDKKSFWGIIDKDGNELVPNIYKIILPLDHKLLFVQSYEDKVNVKWGAINVENFKLTLSLIYDWLYPVKEEIIIYRIGQKFGAIHQDGKEIIPPVYDRLKFFSEGLCAAKLNGKWGYINKKNEIVVPFEYKHVWPFENGIAEVYKNSEYGMLERKDYIDKI